MTDELPDDFSWPEKDAPPSIDDVMPPLETNQSDAYSSPDFNPETFPGSRASHKLQGADITVNPMVQPSPEKKQFSMQNAVLSGSQWSVQVHPGWIYSIDPPKAATSTPPAGGRDPIDKFMPTLGGTALNALTGSPEAPPRLDVAIGDVVSLKIERNKKGVVQSPVTVVVRPAGDSAHYDPAIISGDAGADENHLYWDVFEIESDGGSGVQSSPMWQDDVPLVPFLWTGENIGAGVQVLKEYDEISGNYKWRSHSAEWGILVTLGAAGDTVEYELNLANYGDAAAGTLDTTLTSEPVLLTQAESTAIGAGAASKAILRRIAEGTASDRKQIQIVKTAQFVHVQGNNVSGGVTYDNGTVGGATTPLISVEDGLVTAIAGHLEVVVVDICVPGVGSAAPTIVQKKFLSVT